MSINHLYGKQSPSFNQVVVDSQTVASKTYVPGGVILSSDIFSPASGFITGNTANGRNVKLFYTKIGNMVTITCRFYISTNGGTLGDASQEINSNIAPAVPEEGLFNSANLGPDIVAQMNNDLLVTDGNNAGAVGLHPLKLAGLIVNATSGNVAYANLRAGEIQITNTGIADTVLPLAQQYFSGGISFLSQNTNIVV